MALKHMKRVKMMKRYTAIDEKIRLGYEYARKSESDKACDVWLEAWDSIKAIYEEEKPENMGEFDKKYDWYEPFLTNFVQDLEIELFNAGQKSDEYFKKRIRYCEEMIGMLDKDNQLTIENTRKAIADSHYELGNKDECDRLYSNWLKEDPSWGWGYIGWSDCYGFGTKEVEPNPKKAEEIIRMALEKADVRDRGDVLMRAAEIYEELGQNEKARTLEKEMKILRKHSSIVIKPAKIGRNDPCPCGSGKKYKKCCGAN